MNLGTLEPWNLGTLEHWSHFSFLQLRFFATAFFCKAVGSLCFENDLIVANYGHIIETWIDARAADAENAKRGLLASRKNEKWIQNRLVKGMFVFTTGDQLVAQGGLAIPMHSDDFEAERNFVIEKVKSQYPNTKDFRFPESLV